jgi:hypothetical protein
MDDERKVRVNCQIRKLIAKPVDSRSSFPVLMAECGTLDEDLQTLQNVEFA